MDLFIIIHLSLSLYLSISVYLPNLDLIWHTDSLRLLSSNVWSKSCAIQKVYTRHRCHLIVWNLTFFYWYVTSTLVPRHCISESNHGHQFDKCGTPPHHRIRLGANPLRFGRHWVLPRGVSWFSGFKMSHHLWLNAHVYDRDLALGGQQGLKGMATDLAKAWEKEEPIRRLAARHELVPGLYFGDRGWAMSKHHHLQINTRYRFSFGSATW